MKYKNNKKPFYLQLIKPDSRARRLKIEPLIIKIEIL